MRGRTTIVKILEIRRKYIWPEAQLNFWLLVMLGAGATILGVNIYFMSVQSTFHAGQIWLFPFSIAVGSLTILFLAILLGLVARRSLLPGIVMLGCFILFALYLTGLIETAIQLFGPTGSVNSYCNAYKPSSGFANGQGEATLAWLETQGLCNDWKAVFSFWLIGSVFLIWMMIMAWQVQVDVFD